MLLAVRGDAFGGTRRCFWRYEVRLLERVAGLLERLSEAFVARGACFLCYG